MGHRWRARSDNHHASGANCVWFSPKWTGCNPSITGDLACGGRGVLLGRVLLGPLTSKPTTFVVNWVILDLATADSNTQHPYKDFRLEVVELRGSPGRLTMISGDRKG